MYNSEAFFRLTLMNEAQLQEEIENAEKNYVLSQQIFSNMEENAETKFIPTNEYNKKGKMKLMPMKVMPDLTILFRNLTNIEGYIRKAENLLHTWDSPSKYQKTTKTAKTKGTSSRLTSEPVECVPVLQSFKPIRVSKLKIK